MWFFSTGFLIIYMCLIYIADDLGEKTKISELEKTLRNYLSQPLPY